MRPIAAKAYLLIFLCLVDWTPAALFAAEPQRIDLSSPLNARLEFPNYLLPSQYRNLPLDRIPKGVIRDQRVLLEEALFSVFRRMVLPVTKQGENGVSLVRYFDYVEEVVFKIDPSAKLFPTGGGVRSALAYIYRTIHREVQKNPSTNPNDVLRKMINDPSDIPGSSVRGVASDWDLLISSERSKFKEIQEAVSDVTNGPFRKLNPTGAKLDKAGLIESRALTLQGDIKFYDDQTQRAQRQGGFTVDYLNYNLTERKLIDPERFPGTLDQFIAGKAVFAPPLEEHYLQDAADTALRATRRHLELPQLEWTDEELLRANLTKILTDIKSGRMPSERALGQLTKAARNSVDGGANNRVFRASRDSQHSLDKLIFDISNASKTNGTGYWIPEFLDRIPVSNRKISSTRLKAIPSSVLMSVGEFANKYTKNGVVYHGTPSLDAALTILRDGYIPSGAHQGEAVFGRGLYTTLDPDYARTFALADGIVMENRIQLDLPLRILDLSEAPHPAVKVIIDEARARGLEPNAVLARDYGIDIIVTTKDIALIQNAAVFEAVNPDVPLQTIIARKIDRHFTELTKKSLRSMSESAKYYSIEQFHGLLNAAYRIGYEPNKDLVTKMEGIISETIKNDITTSMGTLLSDAPSSANLDDTFKLFHRSRSAYELLQLDPHWDGYIKAKQADRKVLEKTIFKSLSALTGSSRASGYDLARFGRIEQAMWYLEKAHAEGLPITAKSESVLSTLLQNRADVRAITDWLHKHPDSSVIDSLSLDTLKVFAKNVGDPSLALIHLPPGRACREVMLAYLNSGGTPNPSEMHKFLLAADAKTINRVAPEHMLRYFKEAIRVTPEPFVSTFIEYLRRQGDRIWNTEFEEKLRILVSEDSRLIRDLSEVLGEKPITLGKIKAVINKGNSLPKTAVKTKNPKTAEAAVTKVPVSEASAKAQMKLLKQIEHELEGRRDSVRITQLLSQIDSEHLLTNSASRVEFEKVFQQFSSDTRQMRGYSYVKRAFTQIQLRLDEGCLTSSIQPWLTSRPRKHP